MTADRGSLARFAPLVVGAVLVALVAGGVTGALPLSDAPDGETVVDRVEDRYASAETIVGDATVTAANDSTARSQSLSFAAADPNRSRVSVTHNGSTYVAGTNGSVAWLYNETSDTVRVREVPENRSYDGSPSYANVSRWVDDNTTARLLRTATLDGAETYVVAVEPANASFDGNTTLWVDAGDYRVHRLEATDGTNRTTVDFADVRFNASVHDSTFRPPGDADVTTVSRASYDTFAATQDATDVALRALDADGYQFAEGVVVTRNGRTVALQRYTGDANVTVAATADSLPYDLAATNVSTENVTVAGANATYVDMGDRAAVVWTDDEVTRAVVADLSRDELVDLAADVRS